MTGAFEQGYPSLRGAAAASGCPLLQASCAYLQTMMYLRGNAIPRDQAQAWSHWALTSSVPRRPALASSDDVEVIALCVQVTLLGWADACGQELDQRFTTLLQLEQLAHLETAHALLLLCRQLPPVDTDAAALLDRARAAVSLLVGRHFEPRLELAAS
ncbi:hypothetical protein [Deinococcus navajonensis]|uniref:Uncharacterized protein n=1 Tax=Deinococcus navajonensis TaxID=309884 RepID=A0ABV8XH74_9DEIO